MAIELSVLQRRTLAAATGRILPSDDGPGAAEAGVADYIERALDHVALAPMRRQIAHGLDQLAALATEAHGKDFAECDATEQDALLAKLQTSPDRLHRLLLNRLVMLSLEGFLCHPAHGGNRDGVGWDYIGHQSTGNDQPLCGHAPGVEP